jgi:transposase
MPRAYAVDLRERVMAAVATGRTITEVARNFSVSRDAIHDWKRRHAETGSCAPAPGRGGRRPALSPAQDLLLRDRIDAVPDATIDELRAWLAKTHGLVIGHGTMVRAIARIDRPRKKRA